MNPNIHKKVIQWGCDYLVSHGYALKSNNPEVVQDTPWSYVVRFATSEGNLYLKHTPNLLALEATITKILYDRFNSPVPEIIASHSDLTCFLMKDAGTPLRGILKKQFDVSLLCKAIDDFTLVQFSVADHIDVFLDIGVPDWRLDRLPDLFKQLLPEKEILLGDGLTKREIDELEIMLPMFTMLCKKLSDYSIKQTIVQCDFHDNNILINDKTYKLTFIDLGEIVISHPFFSLIGCLSQAKFHHGLKDEDVAFQRLKEACFKNYGSNKNFFETFSIASIVWLVYEALAQYRLRLACDTARFLSFQRHGKLSERLREFIAACFEIDND